MSTAAQNTAAQNTAAQNTAAQNTAAQNTAAQNTAAQNTAAQNTAAQNTAAQNTAAQNTAAQEPLAGAAGPFGAQIVADAQQIIGRYPQPQSALLPLLHLVQSVEGYVSQAGIAFCAEQLGLATAEVSAVATFYTMYKRRPCGEHLVSVCTNTLCAALGGDAIYARLSEHLGVGHNQTAGEPGATGSVTLEHAECLAACDLGPVLQVNYEYYDNQTEGSALELVQALQRGERPYPTRGAPLTGFRDVSRQLAGFFDGKASDVDAPSAAAETLRGVRLANERGWTAPVMPDDAPLPPVPEKK